MTKSVESYIREFNVNFETFQIQTTPITENLMSRSLRLLSDVENVDAFNADCVSNCQFYMNLYSLLSTLDAKSDTLWQCIHILQHASKNQSAREAIVNQFRFVPLVTKVLGRILMTEKVQRLLIFLQDLTYDVIIKWEEPYVIDLIQILTGFIYGDEQSFAVLSLSVLVNLCYKSSICIYTLLKTVKVSSFVPKLKSHGFMAQKLLIILGNHVQPPELADLRTFIGNSLQELQDCLRNCNVSVIRHIVEFIINTKDGELLHLALKDCPCLVPGTEALIKISQISYNYKHFLQEVESCLQLGNMNYSAEMIRNREMCLGYILEFLNCILKMNQYKKSWVPLLDRILNITHKCIDSNYMGNKAVSVIGTILECGENDIAEILVSTLGDILPQLIQKYESDNDLSEKASAFQRLLITLLQFPFTQNLVLKEITQSYFDTIFAPLLTEEQAPSSYLTFSENHIVKYTLSALLLMQISSASNTIIDERFMEILNSKLLHYILARALLGNNVELCSAVFEICRTNIFPHNQFAQIVTNTMPLMSSTSNTVQHIWKPQESCMYVSKALEERLDQVITNVFQSNNNSQLENVSTSHLIELFKNKICLLNNTEKNLNKKLDDATFEITNLSHRFSWQSNQLMTYCNTNFQQQLELERLKTGYKDLEQKLEILNKLVKETSENIKDQKKKYKEATVVIKSQKIKIRDLQTDIEEYKKQHATTKYELKNLQDANRLYISQIDNCKATMAKFDGTLKEKQKCLEEKEKDLTKAMKRIQELSETNSKAENLIKNLEGQLAEKNAEIEGYEAEINETEELKKTIVNLMERKKHKMNK